MHLTAAKRSLCYLKQTADHKLCYPRASRLAERPPAEVVIHGFTDTDWAGNELTRKSVGGCIFFAGPSLGVAQVQGTTSMRTTSAIHWQSRTQKVIALSTLEVEYIAFSDAVREAIWVSWLLADIIGAGSSLSRAGFSSLPAPVDIGCDNQGALKLIETGVCKQKTKHIDIKYHHVRDEVEKGTIWCYYVRSTDNPADLLTKALPAPRSGALASMAGLRP